MFSSEVIEKIKSYVYILSDPDSEEIFYVGKGKGNRVFSHFKNKNNSDTAKRIKKIKSLGNEPKVELLVHGVKDEIIIKKIEAAIIDLMDTSNLTNKVGGYESSTFGRMDIKQIKAKYTSKKANITEDVLLVNLGQTFRYNMEPMLLYDYTRGVWKIAKKNRDSITHVFAVYDGIVQETYKVEQWFKGGTTFTNRKHRTDWKGNRWEFVGSIDEGMRKKYLHKSVAHYWKRHAQNPVRFTRNKNGE